MQAEQSVQEDRNRRALELLQAKDAALKAAEAKVWGAGRIASSAKRRACCCCAPWAAAQRSLMKAPRFARISFAIPLLPASGLAPPPLVLAHTASPAFPHLSPSLNRHAPPAPVEQVGELEGEVRRLSQARAEALTRAEAAESHVMDVLQRQEEARAQADVERQGFADRMVGGS